jgi:hypothetical protein
VVARHKENHTVALSGLEIPHHEAHHSACTRGACTTILTRAVSSVRQPLSQNHPLPVSQSYTLVCLQSLAATLLTCQHVGYHLASQIAAEASNRSTIPQCQLPPRLGPKIEIKRPTLMLEEEQIKAHCPCAYNNHNMQAKKERSQPFRLKRDNQIDNSSSNLHKIPTRLILHCFLEDCDKGMARTTRLRQQIQSQEGTTCSK